MVELEGLDLDVMGGQSTREVGNYSVSVNIRERESFWGEVNFIRSSLAGRLRTKRNPRIDTRYKKEGNS